MCSEAEDIEAELRELFEEVEVYSTGKILNEAAYLHGKIVEIYPFTYGNEIIGRNIMNYYLMRNGQNPLAIFSEDRESYYNALGNYCDTGSLEELLGFLAWQSIKIKGEIGQPIFDVHQP